VPENSDASMQPNVEALTPDDGVTIPRLKLGQASYNGLWTAAGQIVEECNSELRWPQCMQTYKKMAKDATIAPALNLVEMAIARVPWTVKIPEGYEDQLKDKAEFLRQVMNDMDHSWGSFIRQATSFNRFGFAPVEKVYRKRYKKNGSKHDDGRVGIKALPLIAQDTVSSWEWDENGRHLSGLYQYSVEPNGKRGVMRSSFQEEFIPTKKFMLFRNNPLKSNPEGESPLKSVYMAWKYKTNLEEFQATGVSSDVRGLKVLYIPPRYMAEDASPEDKEVYEYYKRIMRNLHMNEQSGLILPQVLDDQGEQYFKFDVISVTGQKAFDTTAIIASYKNEIISALMASQLILGQGGGGSFSLAESLQSISNMAIESKLIEIQDQLNHDLIPQLFALNGWDASVTPQFVFGDLVSPDLDVLSKFIQRVGAAGLMSQDASTVNWIAEQANMPTPFTDQTIAVDEARKQLTGFTSNAGEGMTEGLPNGTGSATGGGDQSAGNGENT
jgi:hypothetical protein